MSEATKIETYRGVAPDSTLNELTILAEALQGRTLQHVNATRSGGGVAELLHRLVPWTEALGIPPRWDVLKASSDCRAMAQRRPAHETGGPVTKPRREGIPTIGLTMGLLLCSGCAVVPGLDRQRSAQVENLQPETMMQEDVQALFGEPRERQGQSSGATGTSWAYVVPEGDQSPLRFLPLIGALAVGSTKEMESRSFAVGFSQEGLVEGITDRAIARYWIEPSWVNQSGDVPIFGDRNVNARPARD